MTTYTRHPTTTKPEPQSTFISMISSWTSMSGMVTRYRPHVSDLPSLMYSHTPSSLLDTVMQSSSRQDCPPSPTAPDLLSREILFDKLCLTTVEPRRWGWNDGTLENILAGKFSTLCQFTVTLLWTSMDEPSHVSVSHLCIQICSWKTPSSSCCPRARNTLWMLMGSMTRPSRSVLSAVTDSVTRPGASHSPQLFYW